MSENSGEFIPESGVNLSVFLTGLVKHLGDTEVPLEVFENLNVEEDLLAIELDEQKSVVVFRLVDPDEVVFDEPTNTD